MMQGGRTGLTVAQPRPGMGTMARGGPVMSGMGRMGMVPPRAYGSGEFSKAEQDRGYKVEYTAADLHAMDPDRMHNMEEHTMARRVNGTHSAPKRKNLRRGEL